MDFRPPPDPAHRELTMAEPSPAAAFRIVSTLRACLAAMVGFLAFNVIDGVFGLPQALLGLGACIATTVFVFRRSPPGEEARDA
jgi:hypothetical protein